MVPATRFKINYFLYRKLNPPPAELPKGQKIETVIAKPADDLAKSGFTANENSTSLEDITNYNNLSIGNSRYRFVCTTGMLTIVFPLLSLTVTRLRERNHQIFRLLLLPRSPMYSLALRFEAIRQSSFLS